MKTCLCLVVCAIALLALVSTMQKAGPSAKGNVGSGVEGATGREARHVRSHDDGTARGEVSFSTTADITNNDVDGGGAVRTTRTDLAISAQFDCVLVDGNRKAMSGRITAANVPDYIGRQAVVVVEDPEGHGAPAAFAWGFYQPTRRDWTPVDAENPFDTGASLTWTATDAERPDDVGIPAGLGAVPRVVDCTTFPLAAHALTPVDHGAANLQVRPRH